MNINDNMSDADIAEFIIVFLDKNNLEDVYMRSLGHTKCVDCLYNLIRDIKTSIESGYDPGDPEQTGTSEWLETEIEVELEILLDNGDLQTEYRIELKNEKI